MHHFFNIVRVIFTSMGAECGCGLAGLCIAIKPEKSIFTFGISNFLGLLIMSIPLTLLV